MTRKTHTRKSRISEEQIGEMLRLRRQGKSITDIAKATGFHRQTVRAYLKERQADILADEVRKQLLTDELQKHLDSLIQFAASLMEHLTVPTSPNEERDAASLLVPLLPKELPEGLDSASWKARREQQQTDRQNKMLLMSLREHTREKEWWQAFEEWQEGWNICQGVLQELRKEANEVVVNLINETPSIKGEVERRAKEERDTIRNMISDVLWLVWWAGTGKPVEEIEYQTEEGRVAARFGDKTYYTMGHRISEDSLGQDMAEVYKSAFETLCHSFTNKNVVEMLHSMDENIKVIDDTLDPFVLRPLLVRTRCGLCPV
jgi:transcriptional regulator with XRE-family HTH domain